jgi:[protein-PII] uridylyltransferase
MARVAFRTDVEDPDTVAKFAGSIASDEHLKLLCLMTLADVEAVGPGTLTPWKEDLLWRLYVDAYTHLTLSYADDLIQKDQAGREAALAQRPADIAEGELIRFLDGLPRRYLAVFDLDTIYGHVRLARGLGVGDVHTTLQKHDDVWELTVAALDQPYLFSDIAGVLAAFGMDIHRGQALTTPDGTALDVFQFTDAEHFLRQNAEAVGEINQVLDGVVAGAFDVSRLLGGRLRGAARRKRPVESRVLVSNEHSQKYTVVEIVAADAPGLLYRISRAMSDAGCEVDLVLISTEGNRAIDVVHITKDGRKLTEPERRGVADRLKRALQGES